MTASVFLFPADDFYVDQDEWGCHWAVHATGSVACELFHASEPECEGLIKTSLGLFMAEGDMPQVERQLVVLAQLQEPDQPDDPMAMAGRDPWETDRIQNTAYLAPIDESY